MRTCLPLRLSSQQQHAELSVQTAEKRATALTAPRCFATRPAIHFFFPPWVEGGRPPEKQIRFRRACRLPVNAFLTLPMAQLRDN